MKFKLIKFLPIILISGTLKSFIYRVDALKNQSKNIYLISDFHEHTKDTENQVNQTIEAAKTLDASIIVENYDHNFIKSNNIDENEIKSCYLGLLSYKAKSCNLKTFDVDFRGNLGLFLSENEVKLDTLLSDYRNILEEISKYNDSPELNEFYKETYTTVANNINNLEKHKECNFNACCKNKQFLKEAKKYSELIKSDSKQLAFDCIVYMAWGLLEARILHEIYNSSNQNVFVCIGGYHNETLAKIITEKLGYKNIYSYGDSHENENPKNINIQNEFKKVKLNQELDTTAKELEPQPINLIMLVIYLLAIISKCNLTQKKKGLKLGPLN